MSIDIRTCPRIGFRARVRGMCRIRRLTVMRLVIWLGIGIAGGIWAGSMLDRAYGLQIDHLMAAVIGAGCVLFVVERCYAPDDDLP